MVGAGRSEAAKNGELRAVQEVIEKKLPLDSQALTGPDNWAGGGPLRGRRLVGRREELFEPGGL